MTLPSFRVGAATPVAPRFLISTRVGRQAVWITIERKEALMEVSPGVFVSSIATNEWKPDREVGGEMHVLVEDEGAYAGMSRFLDVADPEPWTLPERETFLVLEGAARIEIAGGPTLELKVGDMASLPKGADTTWHLTLPFKELWFFGRPYEIAFE